MKSKLLSFTLTICSLLFLSCEKDKNNDSMLKPQVSFEHNTYETEIDLPVEITPDINNPGKQISYKWLSGDKELSVESKLSFTPSEKRDYTITLLVTNEYGESSAQCIVKTTPASAYRNATFMIDPGSRGANAGPGNTASKVNARLMAIKADGTYEDDAFGKANNGKKIGYQSVQPIISNNKIYILSDAGADEFEKAELIIANANTLKHEKTILFDKGSKRVTTLTIAGNDKAYIGTGDQQLFSLDLNSGETGEKIQGLPRNFGGNILVPIIPVEDKIYGISSGVRSSDVCAIDMKTNVLSTTTVSNSISFLIPESDGRFILISEGVSDWGPKNLAIYSAKTNKIEGKEQTLPETVFSAAAISKNSKELFFHTRNSLGDIYKYNYETAKSVLFTYADDVEFARLYIDNKTNKLYYTYKIKSKLRKFKTQIYQISDSAPAKPIGATYEHSALDIYYALSY